MSEEKARIAHKEATPKLSVDDQSVPEPTDALDVLVEDESASERLVGQVLGNHYEILSVIGHGGLSIVYKARHQLLGTIVAVKLLLPGKQLDGKAMTRFKREAQAAIQLKHPSIAGVQEFGVHEGVPFLVTEYTPGEPLSNIILREGPLEPTRAFSIFKQSVEALAYAHKKKIVHRDIKPHNIIVETINGRETIKLIDFGVAKIIDEEEARDLTQTGEVFGTPNYMSPEQCQGKKVDFRSDLYSLACVVYEMLSGSPPFIGANALDVLMKHVNEPPPPLKTNRGISSSLARVIAACLAKEPEQRYPSADALLADLTLIEQGQPISRNYSLIKLKLKRNYLRIGLVACSLWLMILGLVGLHEDILRKYSKLIKEHPDNAVNYIMRAEIYADDYKKYRDAQTDLDRAIQLAPRNCAAYYQRARVLNQMGEFKGAIDDSNQAIRLNNSFNQPYMRRYEPYVTKSFAESQLKMYKESIADARLAISMNPYVYDNLQAHYAEASSQYMLGENGPALATIDAADKLVNQCGDPQYRNEWQVKFASLKCNAHLSLGDFKAAIRDADEVLDADPKSAEGLSLRARAHNGLNQYDQALKDIDEAISLDPDKSSLHLDRASYLKKMQESASEDKSTGLQKQDTQR